MEPQWTKQIPSTLICNTYYAFFILYAIIAALAIIGGFATFFGIKGVPKSTLFVYSSTYFLSAVISGTLALFMYLLCDRALLATKVVVNEGYTSRR